MGRGRPSFPRTFSWCVVLELGQQCGLSGPTGLSPAVVRRSSRFGEDRTSLCERCTSRGAGSQPPVRKAYTLEHVQGLGGSRFARHYSGTLFASSGYMRCFSSPTYLPPKMGHPVFEAGWGCPIRRRWAHGLTAAPPSYRCWSASFVGWSCRGILRPRIMSCLVMEYSAVVAPTCG